MAKQCAYFGRERAPGRVGRAARALAAVFWWWCVALLRLVALCAPPPGAPGAGAPPPPRARVADDAPPASTAACCASASASASLTPPTVPPPPPPPAPPPNDDPPHHPEWWVVCACAGAALLLCAGAGALALPHLRRGYCAAAATNHPMLSVQVPGCAGMERLGAGAPRHRQPHRHHNTLEWEEQQAIHAMVGRLVGEMVEKDARARSAAAAERLALPLPPSIQLPDGEFGQDTHLQLRVPYQQAELTRSSFTAPPNKSVSDVPEWAGAEAAPARRAAGAAAAAAAGAGAGAGSKKDGLLQKATRWWWVRLGAARPQYLAPLERRAPPAPPPPPPPPPPCVMVPRRPPPRA